ncbi:TIGR01777 family oxidoreductase [Sediminibacterium ginsengisoli]|uniref:TIGR01777 family protein n=1 Tax=Sediminibacterium ginsengisoli TaxID=413434 RepID=A0A1T4NHA0_9BACT|nr:TIGR01777 family oxidoreductase [Sediminibacterium ginsengisoli]SJZ78604.1 hypothetical protein SAMN04488132_104258 [Sediminibacterium ginsengisoli]
MKKKIVIAGGTGFIGQQLALWYTPEYEVVVLSREVNGQNNSYNCLNKMNGSIRIVHWNGADIDKWSEELEDAEMLINLSGKSVNCRYTEKNKKAILDSRIRSTQVLGRAISLLNKPPQLWINAASATIYRHAIDAAQDEQSELLQNDFSVQVCKEWEKAFFAADTPVTRKVCLRMAIVLGNGGVMVPYTNLVKAGLGGKQGSGKQMFSWIHMTDLCRLIDFIRDHSRLEGILNASAPMPVRNEVFMQTLRKICKVRIGFPMYRWMVHLGARIIGTEPELMLKSRWVIPARLCDAGFVFRYGNIDKALDDIIRKR